MMSPTPLSARTPLHAIEGEHARGFLSGKHRILVARRWAVEPKALPVGLSPQPAKYPDERERKNPHNGGRDPEAVRFPVQD